MGRRDQGGYPIRRTEAAFPALKQDFPLRGMMGKSGTEY
jgi:hypothetical protein